MNIYIHTLGCFKNEVDSSGISTVLKRAGFNMTNLDEADMVILNTCGFIRPAKEEAINSILRFIDDKNSRGVKLIVTGCLAQRYISDLADEFPEVDAFVGLGKINCFPDIVNRVIRGERVIEGGDLRNLLDFEIEASPLVYYLKISDGCNNRCNYCAIPLIRGPLQTRRPEDILKEARIAIDRGTKEIVLVAQDLTGYNYKGYSIVDLLKDLNSLEGDFWIRLLYLHPARIDEALIEAISNLPRVLRYVDIPIQHIDDGVLKSMGRPGRETTEKAIKLLKKIPGIIIRTSFIIGYPTETQSAFENLLRFLEEERLHRAGFFIYSPEENTPAYDLGDPVPDRV
ncbi:MAG TPA: MiaB/RimO family radical SAM methylthiotransferase, partial [bacterium]|nr:MiaB/RimO family radical SAM methylthiotransferase [bacterium]